MKGSGWGGGVLKGWGVGGGALNGTILINCFTACVVDYMLLQQPNKLTSIYLSIYRSIYLYIPLCLSIYLFLIYQCIFIFS